MKQFGLPATRRRQTPDRRVRAPVDVHRLLVMQGDRLVGIVTTTDFVHAVAEQRFARRTFVFDRSPLERDHDQTAY